MQETDLFMKNVSVTQQLKVETRKAKPGDIFPITANLGAGGTILLFQA